MPDVRYSIPRVTPKYLNSRKNRADAVRLVVALSEPAQVCCDLRKQRIMLHKRMMEIGKEPISPESTQEICRTQTAYASVADRLLRLAKVPQAPSGAQAAPPDARPTLDIYPEAIGGAKPGPGPASSEDPI